MAATKSVTTTESNFYAFLAKVKDPHIRQLFKLILDQTGNLNGQAPTIGKVTQPLDDHMDANGNKVISLADPTDKQDAATKNYVDFQIYTAVKALAKPK